MCVFEPHTACFIDTHSYRVIARIILSLTLQYCTAEPKIMQMNGVCVVGLDYYLLRPKQREDDRIKDGPVNDLS